MVPAEECEGSRIFQVVLCDTHDTSILIVIPTRRYQYRRGHDIPRYIVAVQYRETTQVSRYRRELATHCTVFYNLYLPVLGLFCTRPSFVL